jgi:hypothetical protein
MKVIVRILCIYVFYCVILFSAAAAAAAAAGFKNHVEGGQFAAERTEKLFRNAKTNCVKSVREL